MAWLYKLTKSIRNELAIEYIIPPTSTTVPGLILSVLIGWRLPMEFIYFYPNNCLIIFD